MSHTMAFLGDYEFEVGQTGFDEMERIWKANVAEPKLINNYDDEQKMGLARQKLTLRGVLLPFFHGHDKNQIEEIAAMLGNTLPLTLGFEFKGFYTVLQVKETATEWLGANVQVQKYEISLKQQPYPPILSILL